MHPLVHSAIDAANRGEKNKAMEYLKQVLATDPRNVDAWLVIAAIIDQPERKRQCLNRVLSLDPTNQIARDELLEMDRAALGSKPLFAPAAPISQPTYRTAASLSNYPTSTSAFEPAPAPKQPTPVQSQVQLQATPKPLPQMRPEKPLVFKYPLFWRIFMYFFVAFFGCVGLLIASQNVVNSLPFLGLALLIGLTAMAFSPKVEIREAGIRTSGMLSSAEVQWSDIKSMKSSAIKRRLELFKSNGEIIQVSTQVSGYPRIVEIIRQKRPDLFDISAASSGKGNMYTSGGYEQASSASYGSPAHTHAFSDVKTFKKSLFAQYGVVLLMIPLCLVSVWLIVSRRDYFAGIGVGVVALIFMSLSFFAINLVKVQNNRLSTESFLGEKQFTARQIKSISMKTVRSRHGIASNYVHVEPIEGNAFSLSGFPEGDEVMYGFLMNWWDAHRNK
ncbi:MAG TPA: tetratricopeptide repeat protein [Anaerolineales bacterium]|nr:tetratricopeptide repeat protein [Anaerolineales bacterium]